MIDHPELHHRRPDDSTSRGRTSPPAASFWGSAASTTAYHDGPRPHSGARQDRDRGDEPATASRIVVTEIPYMVNKAKLVEKIAELVHEKRVDGISDIRDESDRKGMRIVIELKRDVQRQRGAQLPLQAHPSAGHLRRHHARPGGRRAQGALPARDALPLHRPPEGRRHPPHASTTWTRPRRVRTSWRACSSRWTTSTRSSTIIRGSSDTTSGAHRL